MKYVNTYIQNSPSTLLNTATKPLLVFSSGFLLSVEDSQLISLYIYVADIVWCPIKQTLNLYRQAERPEKVTVTYLQVSQIDEELDFVIIFTINSQMAIFIVFF